MTLGNKIQECRKALGLSQEELGQKLLVSRQTVSLWENDQTLPSIDNLTRLKEIFGISVDELLGLEPASENAIPVEAPVEVPLEKYTFTITEKEWKEAFAAHTQYYRWFLTPLFLLVCFLISVALKAESWMLMLEFAFTVFDGVIKIVSFIKFKKRRDGLIRNTIQYSHVAKIYEEYLESTECKDGKVEYMNKFYFRDFSRAKDTGNLITVFCKNRIFTFRKSDLKENSLIYSKLNIKDCIPKKRKLKRCSVLLFVLPILSVFIGTVCAFKVKDIFGLGLPQFWVCFLFLPLPFISVYFGFSAKRKVGSRYVKNIVAGIIVAVLLLAIGSFTFVLNKFYRESDTEKRIREIQEYTGIAIPEYEATESASWGDDGVQYENFVLYNRSTFLLLPEESNKFEETLVHDSRWIKEIPLEIAEMLVYTIEFEYDYLLLCNTDTLEINTVPEKSGTYNFILIYYNVQSDEMLVYDYDMKYTK